MSERFRERLAYGPPLIGTFIQVGHPCMAEFCAQLGLDFILIDCEHSPISLDTTQNMLMALKGSETLGLVRLPCGGPPYIAASLDIGADAIVVPQIKGAEDAREILAAALYPPHGRRGIGPGRSLNYGLAMAPDMDLHSGTSVVLQIETQGAVEEMKDILELPGLDMVFVGPGDLSCGLGIFGQFDHPTLTSSITGVLESAAAKGVPSGIFAMDSTMARYWIDRGVRLVTVASELFLLARETKRTIDAIRNQT